MNISAIVVAIITWRKSAKMLPKELSGPNVIYIYGDYVANVMWLEKPLAFVVKHRQLSDSYRRYFDFLWKTVG